MTHTDASVQAGPDRYDIYAPIHKALRLLWSDLTVRLGALDLDNPSACADAMRKLRRGLDLGGKHLGHESRFLHPALNERAPRASESIDHQHDHHRRRFEELEELIVAVEAAPDGDARHAAGHRVYLAFSSFVAEDLMHMHEEETVMLPQLCAVFTDHELETIETTILASVSPDDIMEFLQIMIPAMNRRERAKLLGSIQAAAPPEAFTAMMAEAAKPTLSPDDFADLNKRLGLSA